MVQTEAVIFTLESVISTSTNVSSFLHLCRGLLIEQQLAHSEMRIMLAFCMQLYQDYKHLSVTSQIMDSIYVKQFTLKKKLECCFFG